MEAKGEQELSLKLSHHQSYLGPKEFMIGAEEFNVLRVRQDNPLLFEGFSDGRKLLFSEDFSELLESTDLQYDVYSVISYENYEVLFPEYSCPVVLRDGNEVAKVSHKFEGDCKSKVKLSQGRIFYEAVVQL